MNADIVVALIISILTTIVLAIELFFMHAQQQQEIDKLKKDMCAWIIWEDGSASPRKDDLDRFKCMGL